MKQNEAARNLLSHYVATTIIIIQAHNLTLEVHIRDTDHDCASNRRFKNSKLSQMHQISRINLTRQLPSAGSSLKPHLSHAMITITAWKEIDATQSNTDTHTSRECAAPVDPSSSSSR